MRNAKVWGAYPTLSRPLTIMGVERRWFMLSATLGLAMWNAINSLVTGGMIFVAPLRRRMAGLEERPEHAQHPQGLDPLQEPLRPRQVGLLSWHLRLRS